MQLSMRKYKTMREFIAFDVGIPVVLRGDLFQQACFVVRLHFLRHYWAACASSHKMGFWSSVSKSGLPGEGRHEGLVPRNDVLTNGFI